MSSLTHPLLGDYEEKKFGVANIPNGQLGFELLPGNKRAEVKLYCGEPRVVLDNYSLVPPGIGGTELRVEKSVFSYASGVQGASKYRLIGSKSSKYRLKGE